MEIQSQHLGGNRQLSMEGIAVEYFTSSFDSSNNKVAPEFHPYISDDNQQGRMLICFIY